MRESILHSDAHDGMQGVRNSAVEATTGRRSVAYAMGSLMDLRECYKQFTGVAQPKRELFIDDVIPVGI